MAPPEKSDWKTLTYHRQVFVLGLQTENLEMNSEHNKKMCCNGVKCKQVKLLKPSKRFPNPKPHMRGNICPSGGCNRGSLKVLPKAEQIGFVLLKLILNVVGRENPYHIQDWMVGQRPGMGRRRNLVFRIGSSRSLCFKLVAQLSDRHWTKPLRWCPPAYICPKKAFREASGGRNGVNWAWRTTEARGAEPGDQLVQHNCSITLQPKLQEF